MSSSTQKTLATSSAWNKCTFVLGVEVVVALASLCMVASPLKRLIRCAWCRLPWIHKPVTVSQIMVFPVKSCEGFSASSWPVTEQGLKYDREWAIFRTSSHNVVTMREFPRMKRIHTRMDEVKGVLILHFDGESFSVPLLRRDLTDGDLVKLTAANIRGLDGATIRDQGSVARRFLSRWLGIDVFLGRIEQCVRLPAKSRLDGGLCDGTESILLQDFASLSMCSEEGLTFLRCEMKDPTIEAHLFRPNIVVQGTVFPDEDTWNECMVGSIRVKAVRWCTRCLIPNIGEDGAVSQTRRPTDALTGMRSAVFLHRGAKDTASKPMFGISLFHENVGILHVGDRLCVVSRREGPVWVPPSFKNASTLPHHTVA